MTESTGAADKAKGDLPQPDRMFTYKQTPQGELKLHRFSTEGDAPKPAIVFFFGGGWVSGNPTQFYPFAKHLANRGMHAYCAEYRTQNGHGTPPRACVEDAFSAVRYLRQHAQREGIDPARLAAGGGSAGGHIATGTATLSGYDTDGEDLETSPRPDALILFNPVYDNGPDGWAHERVIDCWESISPMHNIEAVGKEMPPSAVFLGTEDQLIPVSTAERFKAKAEATGAISELHLYEGKPHGFFNYGKADDCYSDCVAKMDAFLVRIGWLSTPTG